MKKSKLFSVYVLIHAIVLALVLGMGAAAFSMYSGLILLPNPTTATNLANVRSTVVAKVEVEKDKIKRAIKPIVGGCEVWDTFDRGVAAGYYRIKRWGLAASSSDPTSNFTECSCPVGTTKVLLSSETQTITNISSPQDEWRFKYSIYLARSYPEIPLYPNSNNVRLTPVCWPSSTAPSFMTSNDRSKFFASRAGSLVSTSTVSMTKLINNWTPESNIPANYAQEIGYCYVHSGINSNDSDCCCDGAYCWILGNPGYTPETLITDLYSCSRAQNSSIYYGLPWDNSQWSYTYNPNYGSPSFNSPSGCGLSVYNHIVTSTLPTGATSSVDKWVCVANSDRGWDNAWGLSGSGSYWDEGGNDGWGSQN